MSKCFLSWSCVAVRTSITLFLAILRLLCNLECWCLKPSKYLFSHCYETFGTFFLSQRLIFGKRKFQIGQKMSRRQKCPGWTKKYFFFCDTFGVDSNQPLWPFWANKMHESPYFYPIESNRVFLRLFSVHKVSFSEHSQIFSGLKKFREKWVKKFHQKFLTFLRHV